ncbi:MAG: ABC transporter permease [Ruminococcus sp.]|uniref:ABC transporter permease n=1 Tax=Ruminococcus sp. TaxID=41978 RepID=UPI0025F5A3A3|nr:ABC transporter permease [Ruminococcus sp.]MCR5600304.1 ABC transporter permease [Ruminococcus sp.]
MKYKFKIAHIVIAAVNAAAIAGALTLTAFAGSAARSQSYNYAAERWKNDGDKEYGQVSCYFSEDAGFAKNSALELREKLLAELEKVSIYPTEDYQPILDAYSASAGTSELTCDRVGKATAEITAVGGNFFFFHDFDLVSGAFLSEKDLMQDGIVIDRQLAWQLYGSDNIVGMNVYINDVKLYISGVIESPHTDPEERCIGETPRAYILYDAADMIFGGSSPAAYDGENMGDVKNNFEKITAYECVVPQPIENYAYKTVKNCIGETYKGKMNMVNNSERFKPENRKKAFKKLDEYAIKKDQVAYPFWENASRLVEYKLAVLYGIRRYLIAVPVITLIWLAIKLFIAYNRRKERMKKAAARFISDKWESFRERSRKNTAQAADKNANI